MFEFNNLRWKTADYKVPTYQSCTYKVMNPPGGYSGGKVYMTLDTKESGVTLYINQNGK